MLRLLAQSRKMREIAEEMGISVKTIETHRSRIMSKLEIDNLPGLVRFAIRSRADPTGKLTPTRGRSGSAVRMYA